MRPLSLPTVAAPNSTNTQRERDETKQNRDSQRAGCLLILNLRRPPATPVKLRCSCLRHASVSLLCGGQGPNRDGKLAQVLHVALVPPRVLLPRHVVVGRLRVLDAPQDLLVLRRDFLHLPLARLLAQRFRVLHRVVLVVHGVVLGGRGGVESIKRQQQMEKLNLGYGGKSLSNGSLGLVLSAAYPHDM